MNGTCIKQDFLLLLEDPNKIINPEILQKTEECCFEINVLAEYVKTNDLYNDKFSYIRFYDKDSFSNATFKLQKDKVDVATLTDNTYGTYFDFGFHETIYNQNAKGYLLDFNLILNLFGEGDYRIKAEAVNIFGNTITDYSLELCLKKYTVYRADGTCRIDYIRNGNTGNPDNFEQRLDFGNIDWVNQLRIPAIFGGDKANTENEFVKYQSGKKVWIANSIINEYSMNIDSIPNYIHNIIKYDILQADEIKITDYNIINPTSHKELKVIPSGGYEPEFDFAVLLSPVTLTFNDSFEQFTKKRS